MPIITWNVFYFLLSVVYPSVPGDTPNQELGNQQHLYDSFAEIHCQFRNVTHDNTTIGHIRILPSLSSFEPDDYYFTYQTTQSNGDSKAKADTISVEQLTRNDDGSFTTSLEWPNLLGGSVHL